MFGNNQKIFDVAVELVDGMSLTGKVVTAAGSSLEGVLSRETPFLDFTAADGQRQFLAKHRIAAVTPLEPLRKPQLRPSDPDRLDCFEMLGLTRGVSLDDAREAFHRLAKLYHPDRISGMDLPGEVVRYMNEMSRQINLAFHAVRAEYQSGRRAAQ